MPLVFVGWPRQEMAFTFVRRVRAHFGNEMAVVTPNGKLLSDKLADGLAKWKRLPAAERKSLDDLGKYDPSLVATPPPGGLIVNVYSRAFERDKSGQLRGYRTNVTRSWEVGRDHLWLTKKEWQSLLPVKGKAGEKYQVAEAIVLRICCRHFMDLVREGGTGFIRPRKEVLAKKLQVTVEEVSPDGCRLRLNGSARMTTSNPNLGAKSWTQAKVDDFWLHGVVNYDAAKKAITRFDLLAFSETGHFDEINSKVRPFGIAFQLGRSDLAADTYPPFEFSKDYFRMVP